MGVVQSFLAANRRVAQALTPRHVHEANVFGVYRKLGALMMAHPNVKVVVDCGAGRTWHFPLHYKRFFQIRLIGLDIDAEEMSENDALDVRIQCDVTDTIPLDAGTVDLFLVYSGIEHFKDNEQFLKNCFRALRPGGYLLAQFPGRYAPFALANILLPKRLSKALLNVTVPDSVGVLGFEAHYDRTNFGAFSSLVKVSGFEILYYSPGYYSSSYAEFFLPLWVCSYAYDTLRFMMGVKDIASYNLFLLKKPGLGLEEEYKLYAWD